MDKTQRKKELNEFVQMHGTGVNKVDKNQYRIFDKNVYFRIYEYLLTDKKYYSYCADKEQKWSKVFSDMDSIYDDMIEKACGDYNVEREVPFSEYFIYRLEHIYKDEFGKTKMQVKGEKVDRFVYSDASKEHDDTGPIEHREEEMRSISAEEAYESSSIDDMLEIATNMMYDLWQLILNTKRTKAAVFRLFYTDTLIQIFSEFGEQKKRELRHEVQIYQSLEEGLVNYLFCKIIHSFNEMALIPTKRIGQLMDHFTETELPAEGAIAYGKIWGVRYQQKREEEIEYPLSNIILLAYLFVKEYEESDRKVIPRAHASSYISQFRPVYDELLKGFNTFSMREKLHM